ncbi:MAG: CDP-alcohol phosphatidyltransferase family protein [Caldilineales bacterium]|nr:CDP-alcohol phosphatidyltransferase family protein [Caldilineales bacterium]
MSQPDADSVALTSLRQRWLVTAASYLAAWLAVARLLGRQWDGDVVWRWAGLSLVVLVYELGLFWRNLGQNQTVANAGLSATLGPGNTLTLFRGLANGLLAGFVLTPWPHDWLAWLPALLYTLAGIADHFDGYLARISGHASRLGEILDIEFDALGVLIVVVLAIHWGQWPWWFLPVGLARYAFLLGLALRRRRGKPVYDLPPSNSRRALAGLQMGFLSVVLWPIMPQELATITGLFFAVPFLLVFTRDWLVASGSLSPDSSRYLALRRNLKSIFLDWLPLPIRILTVLALVAVVFDSALNFETFARSLALFGIPSAVFVAAIFILIEVAALPFLLLGVAGRFVALLALIPLGFTMVVAMNVSDGLSAIMGCVYLFVFGTGRCSLWEPERRLFGKRAGEYRGAGSQTDGG